jgi:tetratricopeptide (TPR) repeat protein
MANLKTTTHTYWTRTQAFSLAVVSLILGICGGLLIRKATAGTQPPLAVVVQEAAPATDAPVPPYLSANPPEPTPQELKQAADEQAAPLLQQTKADPTNAALLANLGNIYYDAKQYPSAIEYYEHALKSQPADCSVRTDLGTAYWYKGDADAAITQFEKALTYEPTKADTLFNLGIVEWQGKKDSKKAIAAWQKLLDTNPGYDKKEKVLQLMAQAGKPVN